MLAGQVAISHPSGPTAVPDDTFQPAGDKQQQHLDPDRVEDANLPGSLPVLRGHHNAFSKDDEEDLPCRIDRVWYINPYGHEIWPAANPKVLAALEGSGTVVYSIGSLYTSIVPSIIARGVGAAIRYGDGDGGDGGGDGGDDSSNGGVGPARRNKILILNSRTDRETGPAAGPMTAADFARAVAKAAKESQMDFGPVGEGEVGRYVTHLVYLEGAEEGAPGMPRVDAGELGRLGIRCVGVKGRVEGEGRRRVVRYEEAGLVEALEGIIG